VSALLEGARMGAFFNHSAGYTLISDCLTPHVHVHRTPYTYIAHRPRPSQRPYPTAKTHPLGMSNADAVKQLRGPKHENWPVCDPRAAPPGEYGLKSGENGHLARANGAIGGPYCSPAWPSVCRRWCAPLVGRSGGYGGWGCASAATRGWGCFFNSSA
jgi:hypothetical protein